MTSIGNLLKEARTRKCVTFEEVHSKIRIHPRVLQLLEEEKFDQLPGPLFVKSFLKMYSEFLGINADEMLQIYEKESRKDPEQALFIRSVGERERLRFHGVAGRGALWGVGVALCLAAAWIYFMNQPKPAKKAALQSARSVERLRGVSLGNFPALEKGSPLKLEIKAVDNVWLRVTCDGKALFQSVLKRGLTESWTAAREIEIWTGNSSNMVLFLNGHSLGSPGRGVVKKMVITHDGLKIPQS